MRASLLSVRRPWAVVWTTCCQPHSSLPWPHTHLTARVCAGAGGEVAAVARGLCPGIQPAQRAFLKEAGRGHTQSLGIPDSKVHRLLKGAESNGRDGAVGRLWECGAVRPGLQDQPPCGPVHMGGAEECGRMGREAGGLHLGVAPTWEKVGPRHSDRQTRFWVPALPPTSQVSPPRGPLSSSWGRAASLPELLGTP